MHAYGGRKSEALSDIKRAKSSGGDRWLLGGRQAIESMVHELEIALNGRMNAVEPELEKPGFDGEGPSEAITTVPKRIIDLVPRPRQKPPYINPPRNRPPPGYVIAGKSVTKTGNGFFIDGNGRIVRAAGSTE